MLTIETKESPLKGSWELIETYDRFYLVGKMEYSDTGRETFLQLSTHGADKHEAVSRMIKTIESLTTYLDEAKEKFKSL